MGIEKDENLEGLEETPRSYLRRRNRKTGLNRKFLPVALIAAAVAVLLGAGIILFFTGGEEPSEKVANKKTLEIGGAGNLPEASSRQETGGGLSGRDSGRIESAISDMETRMNENHEQLMDRLAELARRVVENNENSRRSIKMMEGLEARIDKLEELYQQYRSAAALKQAAEEKSSREARAESAEDKQKTAQPEKAESGIRYYTVKKNDTLYSIAKNNGIKLETLLKINGLRENSVIHPGDRLRVSR